MIRSFDYLASLPEIDPQLLEAFRRVLHSGRLLLGPETDAFEREFAAHIGAKHCVAVASGTTALHLALLALGIGPGDEVITVANTCAPTASAIRLAGATPVFVDVRNADLLMDPDYLSQAITPRTRAILPVHLWGHWANCTQLADVAASANVALVEDCAQAQGTLYRGQHAGTFGALGCFSFYPTKNLGAFGDGGAVVTGDAALADQVRRRRMYGYDENAIAEMDGLNGRIDELQAAMLRVKLRVLPDWLARRQRIAGVFEAEITNPDVQLPLAAPDTVAAFHQYVIRCQDRSRIIRALTEQDIQYGIHYPVPLHRMPAFAGCPRYPDDLPTTTQAADEILSLPVHESLSLADAHRIAEAVNRAR